MLLACRPSKRIQAAFALGIALTAAFALDAAASEADGETASRPNIVVILSDDMLWGQPGFNGGTEVETPSLDRIAEEGVTLTEFYAQPLCSPTRAALLTGRYPWKNGMELRPDQQSRHGMLLDERTLAQALRDAGYATWMVGKWHLGQWRHEHLPLQRGFDHHYGHYSAQIDSFTHQRGSILDWHRNGRPVVESGYSTFLLANEAVRLIERHDGTRPFFLYLPFNAVHEPLDAPKAYYEPFEDSPNGMFKAMLKAMDVAIGRVLGALDDKGVLDDTLVVFLNDNGGRISDGGNAPYRGGKASFLEGGVRVPAAMRWPAEIEAGSERDALLHVVDLFPTFAGLAGADTGAGLPLDGVDAWDAIAGEAASPRTEIVFSRGVIRSGDWKLIEKDKVSALGGLSIRMLYNLAEDPYEARNLASAQGGKVEALQARLRYHRQFARTPESPTEIPDYPPLVYGAAENAAYGAEVEKALREREAGNPGPALVWLEAHGDRVTLFFDEVLDSGSVPPANAFRVVVEGGYTALEVSDVAVSGTVVMLTLAEPAASGTTIGLTYEVPDSGAIRDEDGIAAAGVVWATGVVPEQGVGRGFTLVQVAAESGARDVSKIAEGGTLDLSERRGDRFSIRADTAGAVGSVRMHLVGPLTAAQEHDTAPYVIYPSPSGGYEGRRLPNGAYRIAAVAYAGSGLTGDVIDAWSVPFTVSGSFDPDESPLAGFALVDADSDSDMRTLVDGETLDASSLTDSRHTVRVLLSDEAVVGSVLLDVEAPWKTFAWGQGLGPYAVHPVLPGGDYQGMPLVDGDYRVTATVYSGSDLGGRVVERSTVRFSVTGGSATGSNPLTGFTLVHSAGGTPDADAALVTDGASLDLVSLGFVPNRFTLRADTRSEVGSVKLTLDGPATARRVENGPAPYALHGDDGAGDYEGMQWPAGSYRVTATAYDEPDGGGASLGRASASFDVPRSFDLSKTAVTRLSLVDVDSLEEVARLNRGTLVLVDADASARRRMTVRAHGANGLGGVRLELTGPVSGTRTAAEAPYTLHGEGRSLVLEPGEYRATATAYLDAAREHAFAPYARSFVVRRGARAVEQAVPDLSAAGDGRPYGLWGAGSTLWVSDLESGRLYGYGLAGGVWQRAPSKEIDTAAHGNDNPTGLWSDGETLWVGDSQVSRLFAYSLSGERRESRDIALGNALASDVWGDGETLWVLDDAGRLRAYGLADGARRPGRDVALYGATVWPSGVWSDGSRLLVLDAGQRVPELKVYRDGTLSAGEGLTLPVENGLLQALWSDGLTLWVTDGLNGTLHTYALEPPSPNATLTLLRLSGVEVEPYSPSQAAYAGETVSAVTTVTAYAASGASLAIAPGDADRNTAGHQVSLAEGDNTITVTVTAADGTTTRTYTVTVTREAVPLTGRFTSVPDGHAGAGSEVTLRLEFSEPVALSYVTLRDEAFEVTGGSVRGARRVDGRNDLWDIVVVADSDAELTVVLPATSDCAASAAVCTGEGKPLSTSVEATVPGPLEADEELHVTGVPQVGETLQAPELEGTGPAEFQWLRDGAEIAGATGSSHVLTGSDAGAEVSVRVTRSGVTRVSEATIPIWVAPGNPPLGADEEELLGTLLTIGSTDAYPLRLAGYGRVSRASFGSLETAALDYGGASVALTAAFLNGLGEFALGPPLSTLEDAVLWAYWDGYRIGPLVLKASTSEVDLLVAPTPQPKAAYLHHLRGHSDGVRVALSIRRERVTPTVTLGVASESVTEGAPATFELSLDAASGVALTVPVSVTSEGEVLAGEVLASVPVEAGVTAATLALATDDDAVVEGPGSVTVTLLAGDGYALGETVTATVTVEDDDVAAWALAAHPSELVEGGSATLEAEVTNGVTHADAVTLGLSVTGDVSASDYELGSALLELAAGESAVSTTLAALADGEAEDGAEAARIALSADGAEVASALVSIRDASSDAALSALSLTDADIGAFDPETTTYAASVPAAVSSTVVTAEPADANAAVEITDAAGSTVGTERTSTLVSGANEIAATVTAEDGETERTYAVTVTREAGIGWGARRPERDVALPELADASGLWSDGDTVWVSEWDRIVAYSLADGSRRPSADVSGGALAQSSLWSDGETLWQSDQSGAVRGYRLSDGVATPERDLSSAVLVEAGNEAPAGLWSDASGMRVVDLSDGRLYGYGTDGGAAPGLGFDLRQGRSGFPWGLWSDGGTALVTWDGEGALLGYRLSDGVRVPGRDIDLGSHGNGDPRDLWSDGETLWVVDVRDRKLYAYAVPGLDSPTPSGLLPVVVKSRAMAVPGADPGVPAAIPDPGLRARIAAALGKDGDAVIGIHELAALEALNARGAGVADLSGLEGAVNLEALDLGNNPVADLRVLSRLPRLAVLNLDGTGADPWAIGSLKALTRLSLRGNGIEDLGPLSGLRRLEALDLGGNAVTDLAVLAPLDRLRALRADNNAIADIAPLAELTALETVDLRDNRIEDASHLAKTGAHIDIRGNPAAAATR